MDTTTKTTLVHRVDRIIAAVSNLESELLRSRQDLTDWLVELYAALEEQARQTERLAEELRTARGEREMDRR